jgi:hypothetical protein
MKMNPLKTFASRISKVEQGTALPRVSPLLLRVAGQLPDLPTVGKSSMITDIRKMPKKRLPTPGMINDISEIRANVAAAAPEIQTPEVTEAAPELIESVPEGLRTAVPGLSAFTTTHLTQSVATQGARGSL